PEAREARQPYVTAAEFPSWVAEVQRRATHDLGIITADEWRAQAPGMAQPAQPTAAPAQASTQAPAQAATITQPDVALSAPDTWPQLGARLASEGDGRVAQPRALAIDASGAFYILDSTPGVQMVAKFDRDGHFMQRWGGPGSPDDTGRFV